MKLIASLLLVLCCAIAAPSTALAVDYTVDSTLDEADAMPGVGGCLTAGPKCTLRAAIEESNASVGVKDAIKFTAAFNGELADTIAFGTSPPIVTDPVTIGGDGAGQCMTAAAVNGPCVGVSGPSGNFGLGVEDDEVTIEGLAVTGALIGINVINASEDFVARNNWIGVKLDGTAGANNTGIFIDPNSNSATIGGVNAQERNVIANNNNEGLDIEGADDAVVRGNYFGVSPAGTAQAANAKDIELTDSTAGAFAATGNEIGATIEGAALGTGACDGGCNLISGSTTGIDLNGNSGGNEAPASGSTTVHGNHVGLNAAGTGVIANGTFNILVGAADNATIGGPTNGDANFIAGGGFGIYHEDGEGFEAAGNVIGSGPTGANLTPPGTGMFVFCEANANPVTVAGNVIRMEGSIGIEEVFGGAEIVSNFIEGAQYGIFTKAEPPLVGNLIEDNVIGESVANGILIEGNSNEVLGNAIYGSGGAGIRIQNSILFPTVNSTENLIGGDAPTDENNIRESGGDAIEIDNSGGVEPSQNEVARNKGEENAGLFIDLIGSLTNGGIQPPAFATSMQSSASGTGAGAGAKVRVFRKEAAEAGEIESFLGEAVADGGGNWQVGYPGQIPVGTIVAATQTSTAGGTSELTTSATTADPISGGEGKAGQKDESPKPKKAKKPKAGKNADAPDTRITKGPKRRTRSTTARFKFVSTEPGSKFECKLDRRPFKPCKSPKKYKKLKPGKHVFKVRAVKGKQTDPTPAKRKFKILE